MPGYENNYGTSCNTITELLDLYPTLTELCGFTGREPAILHGKSLTGYLSGEKKKDPDAYAYTVSYGRRDATLRTERWRYSRWEEKIEQARQKEYITSRSFSSVPLSFFVNL